MLWHHLVGGLGTVYSWSFTYIYIFSFYFGPLQVKLYLRQCSTFKNQKIKRVYMSNANFINFNKFFVSFPYIITWIQLVMLHIYDWSLTGSVPHRLRAQVYNRSPTPQTIVPDLPVSVIYPYILLAVCTSFTLFFFTFVLVQKSCSQWTNTMWVQKRVHLFQFWFLF